jgi:hypothetical protein
VNRQERRRAGIQGPRSSAPVEFDSTCVEVVSALDPQTGAVLDSRVRLGLGVEGEPPSAFVYVCPCEGMTELVAELQAAAAVAAEHHGPHESHTNVREIAP